MTALVTADLHLSEKPRDAYRFAAMERIAGLVEEHKVDDLVILGDLTEAKDFHPAALVNDVVDVIYSLSCLAPVTILMGNHDYTQTDTPFFHFLRRFKRVNFVSKVSLLKLSIGECLFLPHTRDYERDWASLPEDPTWVFAHNTFAGAESEHGKRLGGIPADALPYPRVYSGDVHTPQNLDTGVVYVGSPYTVDFGDDFEPRVLLLGKTSKTSLKIDSVPMPGPQKRLIELRRGFKVQKADFAPGDIVKIRYRLTPEEQPDWHAIQAGIRAAFTAKGAVVHLVQPEASLIKERSVYVRAAGTKSDEQVLTEFGKQRKVPEPTMRAGMSLLREA